LYSGVTKTNASPRETAALQSLVCWCVRGQVEHLDVEAAVLPGELGHPRGDGDPAPSGTGAADDDLKDGTGHGEAPRGLFD
jgi:hypothetical protein